MYYVVRDDAGHYRPVSFCCLLNSAINILCYTIAVLSFILIVYYVCPIRTNQITTPILELTRWKQSMSGRFYHMFSDQDQAANGKISSELP